MSLKTGDEYDTDDHDTVANLEKERLEREHEYYIEYYKTAESERLDNLTKQLERLNNELQILKERVAETTNDAPAHARAVLKKKMKTEEISIIEDQIKTARAARAAADDAKIQE